MKYEYYVFQCNANVMTYYITTLFTNKSITFIQKYRHNQVDHFTTVIKKVDVHGFQHLTLKSFHWQNKRDPTALVSESILSNKP